MVDGGGGDESEVVGVNLDNTSVVCKSDSANGYNERQDTRKAVRARKNCPFKGADVKQVLDYGFYKAKNLSTIAHYQRSR